MFGIEILEQGWLAGCEPESDLCSHGRLLLAIGGESIASASMQYGVSESALALLRTHDTTSEIPTAAFPDLVVNMPWRNYRHAVLDFARKAREPSQGAPKRIEDEFDIRQYREFWAEFESLYAQFDSAA